MRQALPSKPGVDIAFACKDDEWWEHPPYHINCLYNRNPRMITWLNKLTPSSTSISTSYNHFSRYYPHHKAGLIKVVSIFILDSILFLYLSNELQPRVDRH
ncbi:hypothetical protein K469DRAFT_798222 [Zopfia rhizophila CBS 207.26]|uniref:Uncharacterized protein n=1 Tax=Zopfia rhizophila CBS 207.26 TaxID=1314779 RepID=A0A6A6DP58_9PEZI|nr:hypothetical protein K469DRAFT_798222 [Zopfia rhizophila CBS 207.26]